MTWMKRIIVLVLLLFALSGCAEKAEVSDVDMSNILYLEDVWTDDAWGESNLPLEMDCIPAFEKDGIPDKETAIRATQIVVESYQKQGYFENYAPFLVLYDTEKKIWIVSFSDGLHSPESGYYSVGACVSIAVRQENAEVIRIWVGE